MPHIYMAVSVFLGLYKVKEGGSQESLHLTAIYKMYKTYNNPKITKYELCNLYIIPNKNLVFLFIFRLFPIFSKIRMYSGNLGVFCLIDCYFECRIRILCI